MDGAVVRRPMNGSFKIKRSTGISALWALKTDEKNLSFHYPKFTFGTWIFHVYQPQLLIHVKGIQTEVSALKNLELRAKRGDFYSTICCPWSAQSHYLNQSKKKLKKLRRSGQPGIYTHGSSNWFQCARLTFTFCRAIFFLLLCSFRRKESRNMTQCFKRITFQHQVFFNSSSL